MIKMRNENDLKPHPAFLMTKKERIVRLEKDQRNAAVIVRLTQLLSKHLGVNSINRIVASVLHETEVSYEDVILKGENIFVALGQTDLSDNSDIVGLYAELLADDGDRLRCFPVELAMAVAKELVTGMKKVEEQPTPQEPEPVATKHPGGILGGLAEKLVGKQDPTVSLINQRINRLQGGWENAKELRKMVSDAIGELGFNSVSAEDLTKLTNVITAMILEVESKPTRRLTSEWISTLKPNPNRADFLSKIAEGIRELPGVENGLFPPLSSLMWFIENYAKNYHSKVEAVEGAEVTGGDTVKEVTPKVKGKPETKEVTTATKAGTKPRKPKAQPAS